MKIPSSLVMFVTASLTLPGCSEPTTAAPDTSVDVPAALGPDGGIPATFFPAPAAPFTAMTDDPRTIQVSISGEALAEQGYDYTATPRPNQPVFVDGWQIRFERYLIVVDHVRLNRASADSSQRGAVGALVAQQDGPWVAKVHARGSIAGAGGAPETAAPMFVFGAPTAGGQFDPTTRYAFSYDTVAATPAARNVNLVEADRADFESMIAHGWSLLFSGTATYVGRAASATVDPTFINYSQRVHFRFGFGVPAAYLNCHNPELGEEDTPANPGIQPSATGHVRAQITAHTDHFFWDQAQVEGTPARFDAVAARAQGFGMNPMSLHEVTLDDLMGVNPASLTDRAGNPVLDRSAQTAGVVDEAPPPAYRVNGAGAAIRDLRDFVVYNTRGQNHLNSDGLCFVQPAGPIRY